MFKEKLEKILCEYWKSENDDQWVIDQILSLIADELLKEEDFIKIIVRLSNEYHAIIPAVCRKRIANEVLKELKTKLGIEKGV